MSVYIQMTEYSFWTKNSLLLLDASLTERNLFFISNYMMVCGAKLDPK